jgi:elongation factor P
MSTSNQITPGMTIEINSDVFRVESAVKVDMKKGTPFIKTKLRNLLNEKVIEKNFKMDQEVKEVFLEEHNLEYLYPEKNGFMFLDIDSLEMLVVAPKILGEKVNFLKEGIDLKAMFYGETIFSLELPQFLELMVVKVEPSKEKSEMGGGTKIALLETGAKVNVPLFVEVGDILKVDVQAKEYIQRV